MARVTHCGCRVSNLTAAPPREPPPDEPRYDATVENGFLDAAQRFVASARLCPTLESGEPMRDRVPSFWTDKEQAAWDRTLDAFRIDWLQTMWHLGCAGCVALRATVNTGGALLVPAVASAAELGLHWDVARHAIRLGHAGATCWRGDVAWTAELDARLAAEWGSLATGIAWEHAVPLVRYGWGNRRDETLSADRLPGGPTGGPPGNRAA